MQGTKRRALFLVVATLALLSVSACSGTPEEVAAERHSTLSSYLAGEKSSMRDFLVTFDDTYSDAEVTGEFNGDTAGEEFPPVTVTFTYTYADQVVFLDFPPGVVRPSWADYSRPESERTAMQAELLLACRSAVIPSIREAGIVGPVTVHYVYLNGVGFDVGKPSWDATCSD